MQVGEIRDVLVNTLEGWRSERREAWFSFVRSA